jgi:hypothetical protein
VDARVLDAGGREKKLHVPPGSELQMGTRCDTDPYATQTGR